MSDKNKKLIYIPDDKQKTWEEIEKAAKAENRGIGYFLCQFWSRTKSDK